MGDNSARLDEMGDLLSRMKDIVKRSRVVTTKDIQGISDKCNRLEATIQQVSRYMSSETTAMLSKMDRLIDLNLRRNKMHAVDILQTVRDNCYVQVGNNVGTPASDQVLHPCLTHHPESGVHTKILPNEEMETTFEPVGEILTPRIVHESLAFPHYGNLNMAPEWQGTPGIDYDMRAPHPARPLRDPSPRRNLHSRTMDFSSFSNRNAAPKV